MSLFQPEGPVFFQGTYNGQVIGVAAALKTIELLRDGEVHKKLWRLGDKITDELNAVSDELEIDARCYNFGSIWGMYFTRKPLENYRDIANMTLLNKDNPKGYAMKNHLMNNGVFVTRSPRGFISGSHSDEEIDRTVDIISDTHQEDLRGPFGRFPHQEIDRTRVTWSHHATSAVPTREDLPLGKCPEEGSPPSQPSPIFE